MRLAKGSLLRSIQPVRDNNKVGDEVHWVATGDTVMTFAEDGTRL